MAHGTDLVLKEHCASNASRRMAAAGASWFETREDALLTMRTRQGMTAYPRKTLADARNPAKLQKSR